MSMRRDPRCYLWDALRAAESDMPRRNLAVDLLRKLLIGEIKSRCRRNVVQACSFTELLERAVRKYQNRAIETAQVIGELIALAKDMRAANSRGEELGLSEDELAFYDAVETNDSAVKVLGEPTLKTIARELVATVRKNVTIDWTLRENVRAQMRVLLRRTAIRPISRKRQRKPSWSRQSFSRKPGQRSPERRSAKVASPRPK
jgi:type I restriction enzyme, R subunit